MKLIILTILLFAISSCAQYSYLKPSGQLGSASTNGCGVAPRWFTYKSKDVRYSVAVNHDLLSLYVEVLEQDHVGWADDTISITIDGEKHTLRAKELTKSGDSRSPCGGFAESLNCKTYQRYRAYVKIPNVESAITVFVEPPIPNINGEPINVSKIEFSRVTETLSSPINC